MNKRFFCLIILAITLFSSCKMRLLDFTMISSKNIDLAHAASFQRGPQRVSGKDKIHIVLFFPTGVVNIKEAVDRAIETTPGCVALLDGVIYLKGWYIPLLYGQRAAVIEGTPLIDPSIVMGKRTASTYKTITFDNNGNIKESKEINETQFLSLTKKLKFNNIEDKNLVVIK